VRIVTTSAYTLEEAFPGLPWLAITKALDVLVDELGAEDADAWAAWQLRTSSGIEITHDLDAQVLWFGTAARPRLFGVDPSSSGVG
jgi:hypothetical protein